MTALARRLDAACQRAVDAGVVWLLRRGVAKSTTCYVVAAVWVVAFMAKAVLTSGAGGLALQTILAALCIWAMHAVRTNDERREARGQSTQRPVPFLLMSCAWGNVVALLVKLFAGAADGILGIECFFVAGYWLDAYTMRSPSTPPPEALRQLVPATGTA